MSRYFSPITISELQQKVQEAFPNGIDHLLLMKKFGSDIKVSFDFENFDTGTSNPPRSHPMLGYHTLPNGFTFLGMSAGGDWEVACYFIIYFDGKKLRAYVPTEGNPWNTTTKQAYGNDEVADGKNAHKRWPDVFDGSPVGPDEFETNYEAIKNDIATRILRTPAELKPVKKSKSTVPVTLQARVRDLKFYAPGDEASELFEETLHLCYTMYGLGYTERAETLYKWAKEQSDVSKQYAREEGRRDYISGQWGR